KAASSLLSANWVNNRASSRGSSRQAEIMARKWLSRLWLGRGMTWDLDRTSDSLPIFINVRRAQNVPPGASFSPQRHKGHKEKVRLARRQRRRRAYLGRVSHSSALE